MQKQLNKLEHVDSLPTKERLELCGEYNLRWTDRDLNDFRKTGAEFNIMVHTATPHHHSESPLAELAVKFIKAELAYLL
jgi:hypothetical protein